MITDGGYVDGSWELCIFIDDLGIERSIRIHGDWHIGGVMFKLVEDLDIKMNWSDHALWWSAQHKWLLHTRTTLDQYGIQSDSKLRFLRMHNTIRIQLPDMQIQELTVNYAKSIFAVVIQICKELKIRHPEEISLMHRYNKDDLKKPRMSHINRTYLLQSNHRNGDENEFDYRQSPSINVYNPNFSAGFESPKSRYSNNYSTLRSISSQPQSPIPHSLPNYIMDSNGYNSLTFRSTSGTPRSTLKRNNGSSQSPLPTSLSTLAYEGAEQTFLAKSPNFSAYEVFDILGIPRIKNHIQRARINGAWLDSSKSLMEQYIEPDSEALLCIKHKYFSFYELNPKYDSVRINQLYHQARWSLLTEELECTEEEMITFAGLQLQIEIQNNLPQFDEMDELDNSNGQSPVQTAADDEIDAIIDQLQMSLEGENYENNSTNEIQHMPILSGYLKILKPKRFTIKGYREMWAILRDTSLYLYKNQEDGQANDIINLKGCEFQSDVSVPANKFIIKVFVQKEKCMQEVWIKCPHQQTYAEWTAGCRLASRGKTLASKSQFDSEKQSILKFLQLQAPTERMPINIDMMPQIKIVDFIAQRFLKRSKERVLLQRIYESYANVCHMTLMEAKMHYIQAWQQLFHFGITYFVVLFGHQKTEELVGIAHNRIMRINSHNGDIVKTWRFNEMKSWHVNWETREVVLNFPREKVAFQPVSADCKIVHEMVGGYIFLAMRTPDKHQGLDEDTFHKFTGGFE